MKCKAGVCWPTALTYCVAAGFSLLQVAARRSTVLEFPSPVSGNPARLQPEVIDHRARRRTKAALPPQKLLGSRLPNDTNGFAGNHQCQQYVENLSERHKFTDTLDAMTEPCVNHETATRIAPAR